MITVSKNKSEMVYKQADNLYRCIFTLLTALITYLLLLYSCFVFATVQYWQHLLVRLTHFKERKKNKIFKKKKHCATKARASMFYCSWYVKSSLATVFFKLISLMYLYRCNGPDYSPRPHYTSGYKTG